MPRKHYELLDGVRGLAAIAVMYRHMGAFGVHAAAQSYLAVDLFFILSGAVIANAYEAKLKAGMAWSDFMWRRAIRLYPMILVGIIIGTFNLIYGDRGDARVIWEAVAMALVFLPDTPMLNLGSVDATGWSLSYELIANAAFAAGLYRQSTKRLAMIAAAFGLVLVVAAFYKGHLDTGYGMKSIPFGFGRVGFSFFAGVVLYRLHQAGKLKIPNALKGSLGIVASIALVAATLLLAPPAGLRPILSLACVFVAFPAIVVLGLEARSHPSVAPACKALGAVSYPLYLIHAPLVSLLAMQLTRQGHAVPLPIVALVFGPVVVLAAWLLDRYVDAPVRQWFGTLHPRARLAIVMS